MFFKIIYSILLIISTVSLFSYPLISRLDEQKDMLFRQMQQDISFFYKSQKSGNSPYPDLLFFEFYPEGYNNLFVLAAELNLPYETLASLNGIENISFFNADQTLLVSNIPGLFLPIEEVSPTDEGIKVTIRQKDEEREMLFFPGRSLNSQDRTSFLSPFLSPPLPDLKITSPYGFRIHPITGQYGFHPGTDFESPLNTPVTAASKGKIFRTGNLENYGNYIIIKHAGSYSSLYGHLNSILVETGDEVKSGEIIALSGNTGLSTGPHLHFELRKNNIPENPMDFLKR